MSVANEIPDQINRAIQLRRDRQDPDNVPRRSDLVEDLRPGELAFV
jgi:hypothetical protein